MSAASARSNNSAFFRAGMVLFVVFIVFLLIVLAAQVFGPSLSIDPIVSIAGNFILLIATLLSLYFYMKSIDQRKPLALVQFVYLALFAKLAVCLLPAAIYILSARNQVNKPGLVLCACMYFVYSFTEVSLLLKNNKRRSNAQAGSTA